MPRLFSILASLMLAASLASASSVDVISMKDGGMRRGEIVEQVPGKTLTLETPDGSRFVIKESDISMITKEAGLPSEAGPAFQAPPEAPRQKARLAQAPQRKIEDLGQAVLTLRGAWGFPTGYENNLNNQGANFGVFAYELDARAGYEWDYIGVSLGFEYDRRIWTYGGSSGAVVSSAQLAFPLLAEFYAPYGWFKPGFKVGASASFSDKYGGDTHLNGIFSPVLKFIVSKNLDLQLDARFTIPVGNDYDYYGDRTANARWSLGCGIGIRL